MDTHGQLQTSKTLVGYEVVTNGKDFGTTGYYGRAIARIDGAIEELEQNGLIRAENSEREYFSITQKGFVVADGVANQ